MSEPVSNPFMGMSHSWLDVLTDMRDEWLDLDRHGQLNGGWGYDEDKQRAFYELVELISEAAKKKSVFF